MTTTLEAHGLGKRYGSLVAVEDLTFTAEAGEILGVLGPNGAGKTTAIRMLTTILAPTTGTFRIAGIPHSQPTEIRRRTGVLPESAGYPDRQTGEEFIRYHARLFGQSRSSARAVAAVLLKEVGLAERNKTLISSYSRGMRQRLGIARALVNDPEVVVLDEPTLGLDPAGQRQMLRIIGRIARERGSTVLLSTHLLAEVEETCSRVLILNRGRVVAQGTVSEIAQQAAAPRTATLRVPAERAQQAFDVLSAAVEVESVDRVDDKPGALVLVLNHGGKSAGNAELRALTEAGVPVLSYELEGARLSDAFLAMTEAH